MGDRQERSKTIEDTKAMVKSVEDLNMMELFRTVAAKHQQITSEANRYEDESPEQLIVSSFKMNMSEVSNKFAVAQKTGQPTDKLDFALLCIRVYDQMETFISGGNDDE